VGILELDRRVGSLSSSERELVDRLFEVSAGEGELEVPPDLVASVARWYGRADDAGPEMAVARASRQRIVRVRDRWSGEGALFNPLRSHHPSRLEGSARWQERIDEARSDCDFCEVETRTTADPWGRVRGRHAVSAANVSRYDANHGLVVFDEHHPHRFDTTEVRDYLAVARAWFEGWHDGDPHLVHRFIGWNCLDSSGASQPHGHLHVLVNRHGPYARQARVTEGAERYADQTGGDYWRDWVAAHRALGLARSHGGASLVAALTPTKTREVVIVGGADLDDDLADAVAHVLRSLIDRASVVSFNCAIWLPSPGSSAPAVARCIDRGDPRSLGGGVGAMELFAMPVSSADPYDVIAAIGDET